MGDGDVLLATVPAREARRPTQRSARRGEDVAYLDAPGVPVACRNSGILGSLCRYTTHEETTMKKLLLGAAVFAPSSGRRSTGRWLRMKCDHIEVATEKND